MARVCLAAMDRLPAPKGAAAHILANARALATRHEVSLVTLGEAPLPGWRHRALDLPEPNWLRRAVAFRAAAGRVFAANVFDAYHVRSPFEGLAALEAARAAHGRPRPPVIYEVNALYSIETAERYPAAAGRPALRRRLRAQELATLDGADLVLTPSPVTRELLVDLGVPRSRVRLAPNAPSIPLAASPAARADAPDAPDAPQGRGDGVLRLAYWGTLAPWQGLHQLLTVLAHLELPATAPARRVELTVLSGAGGPERKALRRHIRRLRLEERVFERPPLPPAQLGAFLATQDAAVAPLSLGERNLVQGCAPVKILDAMAAGLPVVAPDIPAVRALLGHEAPLYPPYGRAGLAAALERLALAPAERAQRGAANLARCRALWTPERARDELLAAYETLGL